MLEHKRAILLVHVFVEAQSRPRTREQACKRCLTHRERIAPHAIAVKLDQVEGVQEHGRIVPSIADAVERGDDLGDYMKRAVDELVAAVRDLDARVKRLESKVR